MTLFDEKVEALVNPVNCVGVCGKGLALDFKNKFPKNYAEYRVACENGLVKPGEMFVTQTGINLPKYIINFPTKLHWKNPSRPEWIKTGLVQLVNVVMEKHIKSIAIPAIGCGLGGLDWRTVKPEIELVFSYVPGKIQVILYGPDKTRSIPGDYDICR